MSRLFYHVCQDNSGNLLFDVSGTMRIAGTGTVATIFGDEGLTVILPNPMTNHPSFASFKCFLGAGDYDFHLAKSGYTFETLTGVQGYGSMAQQESNNVNITGGAITAPTITAGTLQATTTASFEGFVAPQNPATNAVGFQTSMASGGTNRWAFFGSSTAPSRFGGSVEVGTQLGVQAAPAANAGTTLRWNKTTGQIGLLMRPLDGDVGSGHNCLFQNLAGTEVGSIQTTATATSYATTSDARLKHAEEPLTGALDVVRALRPISHLWRSDDSRGVGFRAHEVAEVVDGVITGEKDAMDDEGRIVPQMIDYSKLVPWLVGALQTLLVRVEVLEAHVSGLYAQLEP